MSLPSLDHSSEQLATKPSWNLASNCHQETLAAIEPPSEKTCDMFHPSAFMQPTMASWDMQNTGDRFPTKMIQWLHFLLANHSRMAALFQQMQNQPNYSGPKNS
ncbi:hypothetical protein L1887_34097 [Cichorium endivia]|nr:hypothetical protein L1887_34097 [Cichorium endivia]